VAFDPAFVAHIGRRGASERDPLDLPPTIRAACDRLTARLRSVGAGRGAAT